MVYLKVYRIEIAIFDILAQVNKINHGKLLKVYFQKNNRIKNEIKIYVALDQ